MAPFFIFPKDEKKVRTYIQATKFYLENKGNLKIRSVTQNTTQDFR